MSLKGVIEPDHMPANKYKLAIVGMPDITFIAVSGLESEVAAIEMPDRTKATGGQVGTSQLTCKVPMHHAIEILAMDAWFQEAQDPVTITYKKVGTLTHYSGTGNSKRNYSLLGAWISKRKLPDLEHENDGDMNIVEYTMEVDTVLPI